MEPVNPSNARVGDLHTDVDPWVHLLVAVIHRALLDARRSRSYQAEALYFLNAPSVRELVALLNVDDWPQWTHERAKQACLRGQRRNKSKELA